MIMQRLGALGAVLVCLAALIPREAEAQQDTLPYVSEVRIAGLIADPWRPNDLKDSDTGTAAIGLEVLSDPLTVIPADGSFTRFLLQPRAHLGGVVSLESGYHFAYAGLSWGHRFDMGLFFDISFGGAIHDGRLKYETTPAGFFIIHGSPNLGSRVVFREGIDIGWDFDSYAISVFASHVSNAGLADQNDGYDYVGLRIGYPL